MLKQIAVHKLRLNFKIRDLRTCKDIIVNRSKIYIIIYMANTYDATINAQGQIVTKKHSSILSKSLLLAGIAFLAIFAFSFGLYSLLEHKYPNYNIPDGTVTGLYVISVLMLLGSIIMAVVTLPRIMRVKLSTIITLVVLYSIANGISFALLFCAVAATHNIGANFNVGGIC